VRTDNRGHRPDVAPGATISKLRDVRPRDLAVRFVLGAVVSLVAGALGTIVGPRFGGAFLAFPAILPASLTLVQEKEGTRRADRNAIGAVLGGMGLAAFAAIGEVALRRLPSGIAIVTMLAGWIAVSVALYILLALLRPDDCDRTQD
jgi:hypothetical protein